VGGLLDEQADLPNVGVCPCVQNGHRIPLGGFRVVTADVLVQSRCRAIKVLIEPW
jgi:hypothetical protein